MARSNYKPKRGHKRIKRKMVETPLKGKKKEGKEMRK